MKRKLPSSTRSSSSKQTLLFASPHPASPPPSLLTCPLCNKSQWKDESFLLIHIDQCLAKQARLIQPQIRSEQGSSSFGQQVDLTTERQHENDLKSQSSGFKQEIHQQKASIDDIEKLPKRQRFDSSPSHLNCLKLEIKPSLPGLFIIHNFLSESEEHKIVSLLDEDHRIDWKMSSFNGQCMSKVYGVRTQFGLPKEERLVRENDESKGEYDIPDYLMALADRMQLVYEKYKDILPEDLLTFSPNDCNANSYQQHSKDFLRLHFDDRALSGPLLLNISMMSDSFMTYAKPNYALTQMKGERFNFNTLVSESNRQHFHDVQKVLLPRRALQIVSGDARWQYMHSIHSEDVLGVRRVSITFRQSGGKKEGVRKEAAVKIEHFFTSDKK